MSIPIVEVVDNWSPKDVIGFLEPIKVEKYLDDNDVNINIIKKNKVSGLVFLKEIKGEEQEKRKAEEKLTITTSKKKWMVNSVIKRSIVYYMNSKGMIHLIQLTKFASNNIESVEKFWSTFGNHLHLEASEYNEFSNINSVNDFDKTFQKSKWKNQVVLIIDEFDKLYRDVKSSCLETFRGIKATKGNYSIWSVVFVGSFNILYLRSNNLTTSPFNVNTPIHNPKLHSGTNALPIQTVRGRVQADH
ncbi:hypothetical protein Glove_221g89 [Diversispora epigaea]|uniref:Uncharacterized protein n=1 Tax=Diversispora epigaea TaxID=1348612 RepID=A0A397IF92_9GLOM|nr:hypothetical protein Glove_221g89 [Diversispora epigaea]